MVFFLSWSFLEHSYSCHYQVLNETNWNVFGKKEKNRKKAHRLRRRDTFVYGLFVRLNRSLQTESMDTSRVQILSPKSRGWIKLRRSPRKKRNGRVNATASYFSCDLTEAKCSRVMCFESSPRGNSDFFWQFGDYSHLRNKVQRLNVNLNSVHQSTELLNAGLPLISA